LKPVCSSQRKDKPFIAVNWRGSYGIAPEQPTLWPPARSLTGAIDDRQGFLGAANRGTLLFDEIGDIPIVVQNQLLRVLQEREIGWMSSCRVFLLLGQIGSVIERACCKKQVTDAIYVLDSTVGDASIWLFRRSRSSYDIESFNSRVDGRDE
jgi:hypothetical protein